MNQHTFDQWAEIYDSVYSYVKGDVPFYVEEARRSGGPVLELGCGTGRVSIPIAQAGVDIVGLDYSPGMLDVARSKMTELDGSAGRLTLVQADMREFSLDGKFNLVVIPFRGFLSLLTVQDEVSTLNSIRRHLAPDGRLIFNIFVPDLNMLVQEGDMPYHLRDVTDPDTGKKLVLWNQSSYDNYTQVLTARVIVDELDESGTVQRRLYRDFQLRCIYMWEMHHLLGLCGFEVLDLFGDFDREPFGETSKEMIWLTRARDRSPAD